MLWYEFPMSLKYNKYLGYETRQLASNYKIPSIEFTYNLDAIKVNQ